MGDIKFKVNGEEYCVGCDVSSDVMLVDYLRLYLGLHGTKYMCREGGCGACVVSVHRAKGKPYAINSCMKPVTACHGLEITTIEGLGNRKDGYHDLQTTLASENGSQCGYCSPSWVMSMFGLLQTNPNITMLEIEKSLASNVCRCTGYRPILEAFKKFAKDAPRPIKLQDIEDLQICKKTEEACDKSNCEDSEWCFIDQENGKNSIIEIELKDKRLWYRVQEVKDIFKILDREGDDSYMLINGNTARGVYPIDDYPHVLIDISSVKELKGYIVDQNLIVNAGTTLTEFLEILQTVSKEDYFGYLQKIYDHVLNVAHIPIRNVASIAGNLMIKNKHHWFASDIFLLLETIGAQVTIQNRRSAKETLTMQQFLRVNMRGSVIRNIMLPPLCSDHRLVTYKVMPRSQNAHALVHAGFLYQLTTQNIVKSARIVVGALSPKFTRATATEKFLIGKKLFTNDTLTSALKIMEAELVVEDNPPEPSVEYRKKVALGLFYKGLLSLSPETNVHARYKSGATVLSDTRPVSRGVQVFETNRSVWPVTQPIMKVEALIQCAGEAFYTEDLPNFPNEVFCAFALSTVALGDIVSIDASKALAFPGVIAFFKAEDIPGINSFTPQDSFLYSANEEVLASSTVVYFNQPIGIVVAETRYIADRAAKLVEATYTNVKEPLLDVKQTIDNSSRSTLSIEVKATEKGTEEVAKEIKGVNSIYGQYHFTMETLTTIVKPSDEGLDVYCSTQWTEGTQLMISRALNMDQNRIDVHTRRVGGSYGLKLSRNIQGAIAAALTVKKLNRPCRFIQSMATNTRAVGKRLPCCSDFDVGVNKSGVIQYINYRVFEDNGYKINEQLILFGVGQFNNAYNRARWNYSGYDSTTDTAKNTWARSPGTLEHVAMTELVMEQIAYQMDLDPLDVRLANLDAKYSSDLKEMVDNIIIKSDYMKRREIVNKFNHENRWTKRGLRFAFLRWTPIGGLNLYINLSVYRGDGSVVITHGAVEMGQGINTKAVQVAAYLLNIPVDKIIIKENNTVIAPNCSLGGGSIINQNVIVGVRRACQQLLERLKPIRAQMDNPTWEELITKAYNDNVDLQAHGFTRTDEEYPFDVLGVTLAEVELDVLTGKFELLRVDLCEDAGQSVSPEIDIGQVEGAFIMGLGYWTCEHLVYAPSGELLTDRTWDYHVPLARDIPQDWRVYFRKNAFSEDIIFGSKCIGEPPICMAVAVAFAMREAIVAARLESGIPATQWYQEGTLEHVAMTELVMEQIAYQMDLDPLDVRLANLDAKYSSDLKEMVDNIIIKSDYMKRREIVIKFNHENRWTKRGLRFAFLRWTPIGGLNLYINLSVYRGDGSVVITHGAVEMGQGINTKAVQVAAYLLNIPVDKIIIKENNTVIAPNCSLGGGSIINQNVIVGVRRACQQLLERLKPIRAQMDNPTWEELITKAYNDNVDLQAHGFTRTDEEYPFDVLGVTLAEVELDVLTGKFELLRVDLCEDAGQSVSPEIDIGQVEGAFIMGLGYWTCEHLVYAPSGELLTDRTWDYHVPLARDIPQDWRVYFRKNAFSEDIIFGSKCIGEPPICMAVAVAFAMREAIVAARLESGIPATQWYQEDGPYTVERNCLLSSTNPADFKFN